MPKGFSVANVESVVASCQKQRFTLKTDETDGKLLIRANQVKISIQYVGEIICLMSIFNRSRENHVSPNLSQTDGRTDGYFEL